ncbi:MAG: dihydrofolate reductase [Saprospiraceae bacterium]|nr:dihydrofolate reductase [Saprospiraceae bacterium]
MLVSAIVATAHNNVIGKDNDIPWYLPADLKYFKKKTLHHHIIMGRKTYQSIGRPLPKRTNVIITRDPFFIASNCIVKSSLEEALEAAHDNGEEEAFIIGGGMIYELSQSYWDRVYLTEVDLKVEGDIYFPKLDLEKWKLVSSEAHEADEKNEFNYTFKLFERKPA